MSCRVKYFETVYSKAGVGKTSAIKMKEDLLFLPVGGKNEDNKSLMTIDNVYNWAKNIEKKVDAEFNNIKGQDGLKIYGKLLNLVKVNNGPRPGVQIIINYPPDLHKALELKNKQITEQQYIDYYKNNNIIEQAKNLEQDNQLKLFQLSTQGTIKPGVNELFSSNSKLANQVYEALGFKQAINLPTSSEIINIYAGTNENSELSNFAIRPFTVNVELPNGNKQFTFQSVEQGFHFYKAIVANNSAVAGQILKTTNGGQLKRLTNRSNLKMTPEQVKEWDDTSKSIMLNLMYDSYSQNPKDAEKLLATGNAKITHTQDNTRWKTDFPEVVMTVRDMLQEEGFSVKPQITPQQEQQAKQLYSQYLDSLNKPNTNPILLGNQQEQVKKFAELQERLNNKEFIEGAKNAYESTPALQQYGTQEQYNDYIARVSLGIIKNPTSGEYNYTSQVKDIVYRGGNITEEEFEDSEHTPTDYMDLGTGLYLSPNKNFAQNYGTPRATLVNIKNPKDVSVALKERAEYGLKEENYGIPKLNSEGKYDGIVDLSQDFKNTYELVVFEPEQIHILGSKQDIQGFNEFVSGNKLFQLSNKFNENEIQYSLKAVTLLQSDKAKQIFDKGIKNGWTLDKVLNEIGGFANYKQLFNQEDLGKKITANQQEQLALDIAANYSYAVEINTAKEKYKSFSTHPYNDETTTFDENYYYDQLFQEGNLEPNSEEFDKELQKRISKNTDVNTQYYSSLTVSGGTNYTENEISTPLITPSIKGHAQFATDKGIAWFRSDEQAGNKQKVYTNINDIKLNTFKTPGGEFKKDSRGWYFETNFDTTRQDVEESDVLDAYNWYNAQNNTKGDTKTRRILEVQSDWTQKLRLNFIHNGIRHKIVEINATEKQHWIGDKIVSAKEYQKAFEDFVDNGVLIKNGTKEQNDFARLIFKNWETFFIKSIIQDSAKKGYEKVLFPVGDTAAKIEGHQTVEEFIKNKEKQLEGIDKNIERIKNNPDVLMEDVTLEEAIADKNREKKQLEKEIEDAKAGKLKISSIANFYETTIFNILKKQGYNPTRITDEYGNSWYEVEIKPEQLNNILLQLKSTKTDSKEIIEQIDKNLNDYIKNNNINIEFKNQVLDSNGNDVVAFYDDVKKVIEINEGKRDSKTLPEELAHHLHLALGKDHILVKRAFNLLNRVDYKAMLGQEYVNLYKNNTDLLKFEILGKLTASAVRGEKIPLQMNTVEGNKLWDTIKRMIDAVIKLFKPDVNVQKELDNLANEFANMLKSGVKVDSEKSIKTKMYQFNQNNFDIKTDFVMSSNNFKVLAEGKKTVTLRNTNYPSGIYKFGENYYKVQNKFNDPVYLNDVKDPDLKKKFIGSEEIIKDYVTAFFNNEEKMYVYYIEKLDDVTQKLIKDQVESNKQALINIDINVKSAYVYYNKLLKKLKKDNFNYSDPNHPIRKANEEKIKNIDLALKELTRLDNLQPLINLVNVTLDEIDSYINRLDLILNNGGKPNFTNVSSTLATLNKLIDFPTTENRAADLRRRLNVYLQMAVKEETDRLTGRDNNYNALFGLQEDISNAKKNFGTLVDIKNLLGRSLGLLIKESQNNIERDNSEIYNVIEEKTKNLKKWASSEGISLEKAYDILQQEYRGTYVLTKPYTSDFYKIINDSFDKPNGHEIRKKIAKFDNDTKEFIPLDKKYKNPNYTKIQNTPALKEYYDFHKATIKNVSDNILPLTLNENFIANVYQKTLIDIFNTEEALDEKTKKAVQHILDFNVFEKITDDKKYLFDESLMEGELDLKYLKTLPTDVKSKDLSYNLLKFMYFANSYNHMSEVLEKAKVFLEVSKNVKFIKNEDKSLSVQGEKSSTYQMMQSFFDMQVLGKMKKTQKIEILGYDVNYGNFFDLLTGFTSLLRLGLNPFNAIANVLTGSAGNIIEASGGRYFNLNDYLKARKIFAEMVIDKESKLYKLIYKINPLQELDDYENLKKIGVGTAKYWEKVKSIMFSPQRLGEFSLQTTPMIAIMLHKDVDIIKNGKVVGKTKMWDAFDENGEWDSAKMGYELSDFELNKLTNRIHRINQMIHGRYSSKDAAILSQDVFFRVAFQFKKWIPAAIESRLGVEQYDERLDDVIKGRWRSYGPFLKYYLGGFWSKAMNDAEALEKNKPLSDIDKYNMYKNAVELVIAASILLIAGGLEDEEDKKKAWYKLTMRQLNQLSGDLLYFYNPEEMSESAFGGVAAAKTIKDIARTVNYIPYAFADENNKKAYYRSGKRKHENKFWAGMLDITPGAKSVIETGRLFKGDVPYTEPNN